MKYTKLFIVLSLVLSMLILPAQVLAAEGVTKTETVNVAQGKSVYAAVSTEGNKLTNGVYKEYLIPPSYGAKVDVELPTGDVVPGADSAANDWYIVDLGKRYAVKEVKLYPRGDGGYVANQWMTHFKILASNDITFAPENTTELGGIGADDAACGVTSETTPFIINLDGSKAYQYIKLQKTEWSYYGYGELEVYADLNVTEVSRGKDTEFNYGSYYTGVPGNWSPDKIVDGIFSNGTGWIIDGVSDRPAAPYNLVVDLGEDMPIGMIEMFARPLTDASTYRKNWKVYGYTEAYGKPDISGELSGGTLLLDIPGPFPQITDTTNPGADDGFQAAVDDSTPYRYLVFSKTADEIGCLTEIRAYTVSPEATGAYMKDAQTAVVEFSDVMDESTIADGLTVKIDGEDAAVDYTMTDDYTMEIDLGQEYFDSQIRILMTDDIQSEAGIGLKAKSYTLFTPKALDIDVAWQSAKSGEGTEIAGLADALTAGQIGAKVSFVNNASNADANAVVLAVLYDSNNYIVAADEKRINVEALQSGTVTAGFDLPQEINADNAANYKLSVLIWKDYSLMKPWISKVTLGE